MARRRPCRNTARWIDDRLLRAYTVARGRTFVGGRNVCDSTERADSQLQRQLQQERPPVDERTLASRSDPFRPQLELQDARGDATRGGIRSNETSGPRPDQMNRLLNRPIRPHRMSVDTLRSQAPAAGPAAGVPIQTPGVVRGQSPTPATPMPVPYRRTMPLPATSAGDHYSYFEQAASQPTPLYRYSSETDQFGVNVPPGQATRAWPRK